MFSTDKNFHDKWARALEQTRKVLDTTRLPTFPSDVPHTYTDKFTLVEVSPPGKNIYRTPLA